MDLFSIEKYFFFVIYLPTVFSFRHINVEIYEIVLFWQSFTFFNVQRSKGAHSHVNSELFEIFTGVSKYTTLIHVLWLTTQISHHCGKLFTSPVDRKLFVSLPSASNIFINDPTIFRNRRPWKIQQLCQIENFLFFVSYFLIGLYIFTL